jgi:hypothetical protein
LSVNRFNVKGITLAAITFNFNGYHNADSLFLLGNPTLTVPLN